MACDAFGVLPPVSKLTKDQAMYHFVTGYTAKVAGTEIGVKEPVTNLFFLTFFLIWIFSLTCLEVRHQTKKFSSLCKVETFSACFGEAFLVHHPSKYGELLKEKIEEHDSQVWLINTGWVKGGYGKGTFKFQSFQSGR